MIKVINGKRYNTDTADVIGCDFNDYAVNDFHFYRETLYRTKKGAFFLHKDGGAMSPIALTNANGGRRGNELIEALTGEEAVEWSQRTGEGLDYFESKIEDA